jgi:hypothetical protein
MAEPYDAQRTMTAEQWENVACFLAFRMLKMPREVFDLLVKLETEKFINGEDDGN